MMRKTLPLILLLSFCLFASSAFAERIFTGETFSDEKISAGGKTYTVAFTSDFGSIFFNQETAKIFVPLAGCQEVETISVCYISKRYDTVSKRYAANITVDERLPLISITRAINKTELALGEKTNATVRVKNVGAYAAKNVKVEDDYEGFGISSLLGCTLSGTKVVWVGDLAPNKSVSCTFTITPNVLLERTSKAKVEYFDTSLHTIYSLPVTLKTKSIFTMNVYTQGTDVPLGNKTKIVVNISSTNETAYLESFKVSVPAGLLLNTSSGGTFVKSGSEYLWSGTITNTTSFTFYFDAIRIGYSELSFQLSTTSGGKPQRVEKKEKINVKFEEAVLSTSIASGEKVDEGSTKWIKVYVENKNKFAKLKDLRIVIDSPLFSSEPYLIENVTPSEKMMVLYLKKTFPLINASKQYKFDINLSYQTPYGERLEKRLAGSMISEKIATLQITKSFSSSAPEAEDEVTVTTTIKNLRNKAVTNIVVVDDVAPLSGSSASTINLNASESKNAYVYKLKTPYVAADSELNITTTASYYENSQLITSAKTFPLKVKRKDLALTLSRTIPSPTKGNFFLINYEISNGKKTDAYDIFVRPKESETIDTANEGYRVSRLAPGESVKFSLEYKAKENKSTQYAGELITLTDSQGTIYEQNTTTTSIDVSASDSTYPVLGINKSARDTRQGETSEITLIVQNTGAAGNFTLTDLTHEWTFELLKNAKKTFTYNHTFNAAGEFTLSRAKASYLLDQRKAIAYSNAPKVKVQSKETGSKTPSPAPTAPVAAPESKEIKTQTPTSPAEPIKPSQSASNGSQEIKEVKKEGFAVKLANLVRFLLGR